MKKFKSEKDRLLKQILDSKPMGEDNYLVDIETIELELEYMVEEGIDLRKVTVRDVMGRLFY
jgi:hypothetical protein